MDLMERLSQFRSEEEKLRWNGTFAEYFDLVKANPSIARLSHGRVFDMIMAAGMERRGDNEPPQYHFFDDELFGLERPLQHVVEYFNSAAQRLEAICADLVAHRGEVGAADDTTLLLLRRPC